MSQDQVSERRLKVQVWIYWRPSAETDSEQSVRFLLLRTRPERGGFWQPVTGSVDPGESLEVAARREASEETGLHLSSVLENLGEPFEFESRWGPAIEYPYALEVSASRDQPPLIQLDHHEHDASEWLSATEALRRLQYSSNRVPLQALIQTLRSRG